MIGLTTNAPSPRLIDDGALLTNAYTRGRLPVFRNSRCYICDKAMKCALLGARAGTPTTAIETGSRVGKSQYRRAVC